MSQRSHPFDEMYSMFDRLARQLDELTQDWDQTLRRGRMGMGGTNIDIADHDDEFVVSADLPGFDRDDINLVVRNDVLTISAEQETEEEEEEETYLRSERERRSVFEAVRLPEPIDEDQVSAKYNNGVLTVTLPKVEPSEAEGKQVEVEE